MSACHMYEFIFILVLYLQASRPTNNTTNKLVLIGLLVVVKVEKYFRVRSYIYNMLILQLENVQPVKDMYGALLRQYQQVCTIELQGKAQDYR